jgi:hypothetical protein
MVRAIVFNYTPQCRCVVAKNMCQVLPMRKLKLLVKALKVREVADVVEE